MNVETVPIDSIHVDPANVRVHPERNLATIKASLARFGQQKPLVVDGDGIVRAGNGTLEAARALGWETVNVVRTPLTGSEATAYAIADNRTAELAEWDDVALATTLRALQSEDFDLASVGYSDDELQGLINGLAVEALANGTPAEDPGPQIDRADELQKKWQTATGQLWIIPSKTTPGGEHRLLCGDCRNLEDVERACGGKVQGAFTSPPYAEQRKEQYGGTPADQYVAWWEAVQANVRKVLLQDGSFFVNINAHACDGERDLYVNDLITSMKRSWSWRYVDEFCWRDTRNGLPGTWPDRFKDAWEPVFHFARQKTIKFCPQNVSIDSEQCFDYSPETKRGEGRNGMKTGTPAGGTHAGKARPSNVLDIPASSDCPEHPAGFPVALPEFFLKAFSDPGDSWLDPFSGSGTTIVAAEQTGRLARGIEIAPKYVAVALERLEGLGLSPALSSSGTR